MGFTKEQFAFFKKYEKQLNNMLEEEMARKRRERIEKRISSLSFFAASGFMTLAIFLYYLFKCKFVVFNFNFKYFVIEISFELAIWGFVFTLTDVILKKTKYKIYGYCISIVISFIISYIFIGLFDIELSDRFDNNSLISAIVSAGIFICCFIYGLFRGKKYGEAKNNEMHEMENEYYKAFIVPRHYNNNDSIKEIEKKSRKKNRKRK